MAQGRRRDQYSEEEKRAAVARVMDDWQSHPDFAHLFDALLRANGEMASERFGRVYEERTGRPLPKSQVQSLRGGALRPTYQLIEDILDRRVLPFDDEAVRPGGPHRLGLFAAAGFIEVTPDSTRQWNEEVLSGWRRRLEQPGAAPLSWQEVMAKLLSFHRQGGRMTTHDIAEQAARAETTVEKLTDRRVTCLLAGNCVANAAERAALARFAGLTADEAADIEGRLDDGRMQILPERKEGQFSAVLREFFDRLQAHAITQSDVAARSVDELTGDPGIDKAALSAWKLGKSGISLVSLRSLVRGLEACRDRAGLPIVPPEDITRLIEAAGFSPSQLSATTHDIVNAIDETTRIKPLLVAIRNASDLSVTAATVDQLDEEQPQQPPQERLLHRLNTWENESKAYYPTVPQTKALLERYNVILAGKGQQPLDRDEIRKVVEVAERDYAARHDPTHAETVQQSRRPSSRSPISPNFE
jgi:hypothetical protein